MNPFARSILIQSACFLAGYVILVGALIYLNVTYLEYRVDIAWPGYWLIWVFAYWPIALAAPLAVWKTKTPIRRATVAHGCYLASALGALQLSLSIGNAWPMIAIKIAGICFACLCITALPDK